MSVASKSRIRYAGASCFERMNCSTNSLVHRPRTRPDLPRSRSGDKVGALASAVRSRRHLMQGILSPLLRRRSDPPIPHTAPSPAGAASSPPRARTFPSCLWSAIRFDIERISPSLRSVSRTRYQSAVARYRTAIEIRLPRSAFLSL